MLKKTFFRQLVGVSVSAVLVGSTIFSTTSVASNLTAAESANADLALMQSAFAQQFPGTSPSMASKVASAPSANISSDPLKPYLRENSRFTNTLIAKAQPDECFAGVGIDYPAGPPCVTGVPKTNEGYVWGLAQSNNSLWFGTGANVQCLVNGTYLGSSSPTVTNAYVCEFGQSSASRHLGLPAAVGDMRAPHIYKYDTKTKVKTELTSLVTGTDSIRLRRTIGLRSVGILNNSTTYLAGPSLDGINIFAFNTTTNAFLGSTTLSQYTNIRKWLPLGDSIYTGVANRSGGGSVLKFKPAPGNPFAFTIVGQILMVKLQNLLFIKIVFMFQHGQMQARVGEMLFTLQEFG